MTRYDKSVPPPAPAPTFEPERGDSPGTVIAVAVFIVCLCTLMIAGTAKVLMVLFG